MKDMARMDLLILWIDVVEDALGPYRLTSQHWSIYYSMNHDTSLQALASFPADCPPGPMNGSRDRNKTNGILRSSGGIDTSSIVTIIVESCCERRLRDY
jgi:hypothetical protein